MKLLRLAGALLLAAGLSACLPTNNFMKPGSGTSSTSTGLGVTTTGDNAQAPCTMYDTSSPTRSICVSCYQSILTTRCPGKADFSACIDPTVQQGYTSLVNQCIAQTVQAGFTCTVTCSGALVLNPQTCTCVVPTPNPTNTGGSGNTDVGQTDFGPPIVSAAYPQAGMTGTPVPAVAPTACAGSFPLYLAVQNRGSTVYRLNQYGLPAPTGPKNAETTPVPYISGATTPVGLTTQQLADAPGYNALSTVSFRTGGAGEITGASAPTGGAVATITTISGSGSDGITASGDGSDAKSATWAAPSFATRDQDGNVYFSDSAAHVVRVICYQPTATHPYCPSASAAVGSIQLVAGKENTAGSSAPNVAAGGNNSRLTSPHGLAIDQAYDLFIADSGNHVIRVICGTGAGTACNLANTGFGAPVAGNLYIIGNVASGSPGFSTSQLNYPYGLDVTVSGGAANIYIADYQNHAIRVWCGYVNAAGGCAAASNNLVTLLNTAGTPSYLPDSTAPALNFARYPTDVKVSTLGSLAYADSGNHLIRAICFASGLSDFCAPIAPGGVFPKILTLAGKIGPSPGYAPQAGDTGQGASATLALLTYPYQILLSKQWADESAGPHAPFNTFQDNNIIFTERLLAGSLAASQSSATSISGLTGVQGIAMGSSHTCFLNSANGIQCMGDNTSFQIGNASASNPQTTPLQVTGLTSGRVLVASGSAHSCSTNSSGSDLRCWGSDSAGQLGNGSIQAPPTTPAVVAPAATSSGAYNLLALGAQHSCARDSGNGRIYCWGDNTYGQLAGGNNTTPRTTMTDAGNNVNNGSTYTILVAGYNHTCAWAAVHGKIQCWGNNSKGQLGNGGTTPSNDTVDVSVLASATALGAGGDHTCAISGGLVYCWGSNSKGEAGIGSTATNPVNPTQVMSLAAYTPTQLALGTNHSCVLVSTGAVKCWGSNNAGQLGNDEVPMSTVPMDVVGLPGAASAIAASGDQTCALVGGVPYCWGSNANSQLGTAQLFTEPSGNTVRIICGDNSTGASSSGFCQGKTANTIYRIAGVPGRAGNHGTGDGSSAQGATFAKVSGIAFDRYKNLVVGSGGFTDSQGKSHVDASLRLIYNAIIGPMSGVKYTVTDSNGQTSYWCLRLRALTACDSTGSCACSLSPPTQDLDSNFWEARSQNAACP